MGMLSDSSPQPRPIGVTSIDVGPIGKSHRNDSPLSTHSFNKQLLGTFYGSGSLLGTGGSQMTKTTALPSETSRLASKWHLSI